MVKMKRVSFWCPVSDLEICKRHSVNVSEVCRDAITLKSYALRTDKGTDKIIEETEDKLLHLKRMKEQELREEEAKEEILGPYNELMEKFMEDTIRIYERNGIFSRPVHQRRAEMQGINFEDVLERLPETILANIVEYDTAEVTGTKVHKGDEGAQYKTGLF